jgi:hypothetical protein
LCLQIARCTHVHDRWRPTGCRAAHDLRALIDTFRRSRRWGRRQQRPIAASSGSHRRRRHLGRPHGRKAPVQAGTVGELRRHHTGGGAGAGAGDALRGVLAGDAWAWAGTTTDSTMGLNHLEGMRMATVAPPTNILRTRRRVVLPSFIGIPRSESHPRAVDRSRVESKRAPNAESRKAPLRFKSHTIGSRGRLAR